MTESTLFARIEAVAMATVQISAALMCVPLVVWAWGKMFGVLV